MPLVLPAGHDQLSAREPDQRRFEDALRKIAAERGALRKAIAPWAGKFSDVVLEATIFQCGQYYGASLPGPGQSRNSRAKLNRTIRNAARLADRLIPLLRALSNSRDPIVRRWLNPILSAHFDSGDGLPPNLLDPGCVRALDELWRILALLDQALPDDIGGNRRTLAFADLAHSLAAIYCKIMAAETAPISKRGPFFRYVAKVVDLLKAIEKQFPKARFDLPRSDDDEALRKSLSRIRRTQPTS